MDGDTLLQLIAGTLGVPPAEISEASDMTNTAKWDSLRQVMLMTELETNFDVELSDQEMLDATSVTKIRRTVSSALSSWVGSNRHEEARNPSRVTRSGRPAVLLAREPVKSGGATNTADWRASGVRAAINSSVWL